MVSGIIADRRLRWGELLPAVDYRCPGALRLHKMFHPLGTSLHSAGAWMYL
jgi:hypothetical protein